MGKLTKWDGAPPNDGRPSGNVVLLPVRTDATSEPQLTAEELRRVRTMLDQFDAVKTACPVARRAIGD